MLAPRNEPFTRRYLTFSTLRKRWRIKPGFLADYAKTRDKTRRKIAGGGDMRQAQKPGDTRSYRCGRPEHLHSKINRMVA